MGENDSVESKDNSNMQCVSFDEGRNERESVASRSNHGDFHVGVRPSESVGAEIRKKNVRGSCINNDINDVIDLLQQQQRQNANQDTIESISRIMQIYDSGIFCSVSSSVQKQLSQLKQTLISKEDDKVKGVSRKKERVEGTKSFKSSPLTKHDAKSATALIEKATFHDYDEKTRYIPHAKSNNPEILISAISGCGNTDASAALKTIIRDKDILRGSNEDETIDTISQKLPRSNPDYYPLSPPTIHLRGMLVPQEEGKVFSNLLVSLIFNIFYVVQFNR